MEIFEFSRQCLSPSLAAAGNPGLATGGQTSDVRRRTRRKCYGGQKSCREHSASETSLRAEPSSGNRRLRELDWKSLPCTELPRPSFYSDEWRRKQKLPAAKEVFEVQAVGWGLKSVEKLPPALRPDPGFRRFIRSRPDFLMLDALGNAQGFDDSKAAVLRYLSRCPQGDGWIRFGTRAGASADVGRALALLGTRAAGDQGRTRPNRSNYGSRDSGAEANRNLQFEASAEPGPGCRKLRRSANFSQVAFNRSSASYKILQCFLGKPFGYGLAKVWLRFGYTVEFDRSTEKPENRLQIPIRFSNKTPFGLLENGF